MGRKRKIKTEEVALDKPAEDTSPTNAAVFTEYPSVNDNVVEVDIKKEEPKVSEPVKLEPIEDLALKVKNEIEALGSGLNVVYTKQFGKMIRVLGNNGMHCFSRVREVAPGSFIGEFLSFIPVQHLKSITAIYTKLGIANKNGTYLSTSGLV